MGFINFYATVFWRTFLDSVSLSQSVIFVLLVALSVLWPRLSQPDHVQSVLSTAKTAGVIFAILFALRLPFTIYNYWKTERDAKASAECLVRFAQDRSKARAQLAVFARQAEAFIFANLPKNTSDKDMDAFFKQTNDWYISVQSWVGKYLGDTALVRLTDMATDQPTVNWDRRVNEKHNTVINALIRIKQNIGILMSDSYWDDFNARTKSLDCATSK